MRYGLICLLIFLSLNAKAQTNIEDSSSLVDIDYWDSTGALYHNFIPFHDGDSWTLYDIDSGVVHSEFKFDSWLPQHNFSETFALKKDGFYGALDYSGDTLLPFEYDTIVTTYYGAFGSKNKEWYFPQYGEMRMAMDTVQLDSISGKGQLVYLYRNNKVGIYSNGVLSIPAIYDAVHPINVVEFYNKSPEVLLAFDGKEYRFFDYLGNDLLGTSTPEFELMRDQFVRFKKNGRWSYFNFETGKSFDSNGNDVVLYTKELYKVYGEDRKFPTVNYYGKKLSGYEDYFPLNYDFIAFRNGGKVGLMDVSGTVHIAPRYDKIEIIDAKREYFKFFRGDSCGLVTKSGEELFQPAFANIISTENPDRLLVTKNDFTGVVDKYGKTIIPAKYTSIKSGQDCFFLLQGNNIGLADFNGKIIFKPQFRHYAVEYGNYWGDNFYAIVFKDYSGKLLLANNRGPLTSKKFNDYNFGNQTFKLYRSGEVEVLVLSDETEIEESVSYPNISSFVVKKGNSDSRVRWGLSTWDKSYLEENQLNGKFGLRYFRETGLAVAPVYNEIQITGLNGYFGERLDEGVFQLTDEIQLRRRAVYDHMYIGTAAIENEDLVSAESVIHNTSSNWTYTVVAKNKNNHGTIEIPHEFMPFKFSELNEMNLTFSRQFGTSRPKTYFIDSKPVVCSIDSAEISLFEYFQYFSTLGGLRMTPETAPLIMNPDMGIRFEGGTRRVSDKNAIWNSNAHLRFDPWKTFHDFRFTEAGDFLFTKNVGDTALWDLRDYMWDKDTTALPSRKCIDYKDVSTVFGTRLELKEEGATKCILHEDFPEFEYILCDSLERKYFAGRLIIESKKGVSLLDPNGKSYAENLENIRYLGEGFFGLKSNGVWRVTDRDGEAVMDRVFSSVGNVYNGRFAANNGDLVGIYTTEGEVVVETNESLKYVEGSLYKVRLTPQEVWFDAETKEYDTLRADEEYLGNRTFLSDLDDDSYELRQFGALKPTKISADSKPRCQLNAITYKKRKKLFVMSTTGDIETFKKASGPRKMGDFLVIEDKKEKHILSADGTIIHTVDDEVRLKNYQSKLLVHTSDTNYLVAQTGNTIPFDLNRNQPDETSTTLALEIVNEAGKYGANRNDEQIVPNKYDRLVYLGNGEFEALQKFSVNLYDADLKQINPIPYHHCYFIDEDVLIFELNRQWYFYKKDAEWKRLQ